MLGYASFLVPAILGVLGWNFFWCRTVDAGYTKAIGATLFVGCLAALLSLVIGNAELAGRTFRAGGYVGEWIGGASTAYLNRPGSIIVDPHPARARRHPHDAVLVRPLVRGRLRGAAPAPARAAGRLARVARGAAQGRAAARSHRQAHEEARRRPASAEAAQCAGGRAGRAREGKAKDVAPPSRRRRGRGRARAGRHAAPRRRGAGHRLARVARRAAAPSLPLGEIDATARTPVERRMGGYTLPPLSLLDAPKVERKIDERELMEGARLLEEKCREFSVEGSVVQIHPGPVVTTFEFKPDAGVKYSKITGLADDLCLALQAESIIIDRLPGKSTVGHPGAEPAARADFAARAARVGDLSQVASAS